MSLGDFILTWLGSSLMVFGVMALLMVTWRTIYHARRSLKIARAMNKRS